MQTTYPAFLGRWTAMHLLFCGLLSGGEGADESVKLKFKHSLISLVVR